jgi:pyridoxine 5-phosphate synthase
MIHSFSPIRLGVNIDHVATLRNARGGVHPCPVQAALTAQAAGADGITAHLREDRRHIRDADMWALKEQLTIPLNFEMAATQEMQALAFQIRPHAVCIVPEKRAELTTEGGLDVVGQGAWLRDYIAPLCDAGIRVSVFIDATMQQVDAAHICGAQVVEIHTGHYAEAHGGQQESLLKAIEQAAIYADNLGLECHAGHGLTYDNTPAIAAISVIKEVNIGHFIIGEAVTYGLSEVIARFKAILTPKPL